MYYVYVLRSDKDGKFYIGQTNNLENRMWRHKSGYIVSTKNRRPLKLVFYEEYPNRSQAMRREKFLKSGEGHKIIYQRFVDAARETGSE